MRLLFSPLVVKIELVLIFGLLVKKVRNMILYDKIMRSDLQYLCERGFLYQ